MHLLEDRRIGGRVDYVLTRADRLMHVPDEIRLCVGFIAAEKGKGRQIGGTFFLLAYDIGESAYTIYGVTAAHVLEQALEGSLDGNVYLRMNAKPSGLRWVVTRNKDWIRHSDPDVDVAVLPLSLPVGELDFRVYPIGSSLTEERIKEQTVGPGEEVFITGLFANRPGQARNIPIIRTGSIAAMPDEPVSVQWHRAQIDAYLVEARSIGGLSGSPVFVHLGIVRKQGTKTVFATNETGIYYLMGLMHGHYDVSETSDVADVEDEATRRERINMGIGIVVPVSKIRECLDQPALMAARARLALQARAEAAATPDAASEQRQPS